jgi:hypothetical protein
VETNVAVADDPATLKDAAEAIETVAAAWDRMSNARSPLDQAQGMVDMSNAMSDLRTWHPEYDYKTHTLPFEREEAE